MSLSLPVPADCYFLQLWVLPCSCLLSLLLPSRPAFLCRLSARRGDLGESPCPFLSRLAALSCPSLAPACSCLRAASLGCKLDSTCSALDPFLASSPCCSSELPFPSFHPGSSRIWLPGAFPSSRPGPSLVWQFSLLLNTFQAAPSSERASAEAALKAFLVTPLREMTLFPPWALSSGRGLSWSMTVLWIPPRAAWGRGVQLLIPARGGVLFPSLGHTSVHRRRSLSSSCCRL